MEEHYQLTPNDSWKGRTTTSSDIQYWYQAVKKYHLKEFLSDLTLNKKVTIGLLGYACDEGVDRNLGRVGAKNAPLVVRKKLAKLAYHASNKNVVDFGDIVCSDNNLESTQKALSVAVKQMLSKSILPILIGGGHDIAYGHYLGIHHFLKTKENNKVGIINFDAHFDLRPIENQSNSGTPFHQILTEFAANANYFVLGIQEPSNTKELFSIAEKKEVNYILNYDCNTSHLETIKKKLEGFIAQNDYIYITIDMDVFSLAYSPGVSAPSPLGISPFFVLEILAFLLKSKKIISCDIAEFNPKYDIDNATANLVARLIDFITIHY